MEERVRSDVLFQHTAARRRLGLLKIFFGHSKRCFNTQPPEGGWNILYHSILKVVEFQHTAARRRLG